MKNLIFLLCITGLILMSCKGPEGEKVAVSEAAEVAVASGKTVVISTDESSIGWLGSKLTGTHTGTIGLSQGSVTVQDGRITGGAFIIDMNSITITDLEGGKKAGLENHLKGFSEGKEDHFFNVAKYPTGKFEISKIVILDGDEEANSTVYGNLTIRDITKEVGFRADIEVSGERVKVTSPQFTIDRTQWGVNYGSQSVFDNLGDKFINDEIALSLNITGGQAAF